MAAVRGRHLTRWFARWTTVFVSLWALEAQPPGPPPAGYLGPMQPIPFGPSMASPAGPLAPVVGTLLPNVRVNDRIDDAPDQTQSETTIAVDPTNPRRLVGGFNDCRGFSIPIRNGVSGWGFSVDGATTWTPVPTGLPKASPADFGTRGDPSIDGDADGNFYYASLYQRSGLSALNISVHKGRFAGDSFTWGTPTFATNFTAGFGPDKEHIGADKRPGSQTLYVSYTNFTTFPRQIEVVRSTDGGQTWSAPVMIASGNVQGSVPRVGPDGELYVAWVVWPELPRQVLIRKAVTWPNFGPAVVVSDLTLTANPPFNSRNPQFPAMDIDRTIGPSRGRVYVTFDDGRFGGPVGIGTVLLTHSPDGSTGSWSTPVRLDDDRDPPSVTGTHRWFSWPAVDPRGVVHVAWYDRRLRNPMGDLTDVFSTEFRVGVGPGPNQRLTDRSFSMNVPSSCTPNFGDYNGSAVGASTFHFIYGDGREGNPDTFTTGVIVGPILANPSTLETCRPAPVNTSITVLGGVALFSDDVTLSLLRVTPAPPPGGEITATFNPNPVPSPPPEGRLSTMTITTTALTPPGTYTLTVQGSDGTLVETADIRLVVRSQAPGAPALQSPVNGEDNVIETPAFVWSETTQASQYRLQVFSGLGCLGTALRNFDNIPSSGGTTARFTVPGGQALPLFQNFSWNVTARNSCGNTVSSQCFTFRTRSCVTTPHDIALNGGFEQDLTGWIVDATTPRPLVVLDQHRSGVKALRLGFIGEAGTPTQRGDSEVHQTITIPETASGTELSFWFYGQSSDSPINDQQEVFVVPISPPGPAALLMREANNSRAFTRRSFSLDAFRGKTIEIHFRVRNDGNNLPTGMFVDDVAITFVSCGGPDFFLTTVAPSFNEVCAGDAIDFTVGAQSLNGPNFTSPVILSAANLPADASVSFAQNPIRPGASTAMTLRTASSTGSGRKFFSVIGRAETAPPPDPRSTSADTFVSANIPGAPGLLAPLDGQLNIARRPTLSWTEPFVENSPPPPSAVQFDQTGGSLSEISAGFNQINSFGAARYRIQVAADSEFATPTLDVETTDTSFTVPLDLEIATRYFWRVNGRNACGSGEFSLTGSFVTGACFEGWSVNPPIPIANGPSQASAVAAAGKIYIIGGGIGAGPDTRINQVWVFDPAAGTWTRKADVPIPGPGSTFGSAAEFGGRIYVFGGLSGPPGPLTVLSTLWIYDVNSDTWRRGRDLPVPNFGSAVAAIGERIILAGGSGFGNQTWEYDPAADSYRRLADLPFSMSRLHAAVVRGEVHAFSITNHLIYNVAANQWSFGLSMPFFVVDPAVVELSGKVYVIGGRPTAQTQIFDPDTNTWSRGPALPGLPSGLDNTAGAAIGLKIFVVGGLDAAGGSNAHRAFKLCGLTSAQLISYAVDGDGTLGDIPNERTSLILGNDLSGANASATVFFSNPDGTLDSSASFSLAPNEVKVIPDILRQVRGSNADQVQNTKGNLTVLATEPISAAASVINNSTGDPTILDGQVLGGVRNGFVPIVQLNDLARTQVVFNNGSDLAANVQLLAYPPEGGDSPVASASITVAPHGLADFPDIVSALGLSAGYSGQLNWNSTQPLAVFARQITSDDGFSGTQPVHSVTDGSSTLFVAYVEDTEEFSSSLQINNTGQQTANVTVRFVDVPDPTGGTPGSQSSRDLPVAVNSATNIPNIIRWALRLEDKGPPGKRGFLVIASPTSPPQPVTVAVSLVNNASRDPMVLDGAGAIRNAFTPMIMSNSRIAIANAGARSANVQLLAFDADGTPVLATPVRIRVAPGGQAFTEDIVTRLGLPSTFFGSMKIGSDAPVLVFNQQRTDGGTDAIVPVYPR